VGVNLARNLSDKKTFSMSDASTNDKQQAKNKNLYCAGLGTNKASAFMADVHANQNKKTLGLSVLIKNPDKKIPIKPEIDVLSMTMVLLSPTTTFLKIRVYAPKTIKKILPASAILF
jgi:hypothetical protein